MKAYDLPGAYSASIAAAGAGAGYRADLWVPPGDAPASGWAVLYLLDGSVCFGTAVDAVRRMAKRPDATGAMSSVVVGLSSETGYDVPQRERDYKEPGANAFLDFIADTLVPWVESQISVDRDRRMLFGHSLGGYFTLWAMTRQPLLFRAYMAVSPSIWVDREGLFADAAAMRPGNRDVALLLGGWEADLPPWQAALPNADAVRARRGERDMVGAARAFTELLAGVMTGGEVSFALLDEEDHASIVSAAIPRALRLLSRGEEARG